MHKLAQIFVMAVGLANGLSACSGKQACTDAGGQCIGVTPTGCQDGIIGDPDRYDCGGGVGVECCLPAADAGQ